MRVSSAVVIVAVALFASCLIDDADAGFRLRRALRRVRIRIRLRRLAKPACMVACTALSNAFAAAACRLACSRAKRDVSAQGQLPIEFEKYDFNQDGKISTSEFHDVTQLPETTIEEAFLLADTNKDGALDETEFYTAPFDFVEDKDQLDKLVDDPDFDNVDLDDL